MHKLMSVALALYWIICSQALGQNPPKKDPSCAENLSPDKKGVVDDKVLELVPLIQTNIHISDSIGRGMLLRGECNRVAGEIRSRIEREMGEPIVRTTEPFDLRGQGGVNLIWKLKDSERILANMIFLFRNNEVFLMKTFIPGKNIGTMILAEILGHTFALSVTASLQEDNLKALKVALSNGDDFKTAVAKTPFGKSMQEIGYELHEGESGRDPIYNTIQVKYRWLRR